MSKPSHKRGQHFMTLLLFADYYICVFVKSCYTHAVKTTTNSNSEKIPNLVQIYILWESCHFNQKEQMIPSFISQIISISFIIQLIISMYIWIYSLYKLATSVHICIWLFGWDRGLILDQTNMCDQKSTKLAASFSRKEHVKSTFDI